MSDSLEKLLTSADTCTVYYRPFTVRNVMVNDTAEIEAAVKLLRKFGDEIIILERFYSSNT